MHPNDEKLIEYVDGRAAADTRAHLERGCARCGDRLDAIRGLLTSMRSDRDADPPAAWVARAVALRAGSRAPSAVDRIAAWVGNLAEEIAHVVSDSWAGPGDLALAGIRSGANARRIRFETDRVELDLQIEREPGTSIVTGQFVTTSRSPVPIVEAPFLVLTGGADPVQGTTDLLGEFSVDSPPGPGLQLRLRYEDRIVRFDVPPEPPPVP